MRNVTVSIRFNTATANFLAQLAGQEHKSISRLTKELVLEALEYREDMALSSLAGIRDTENTKKHNLGPF